MKKGVEVRIATPEDEDEIIRLALKLWEENGMTDIDVDRVRAMIRPALYLWEGICGVIGKPGGQLEAGVLLRVTQMWYSNSYVLEEKAVFVDPEFRNSRGGNYPTGGRARKLCDFSKKVADDLGIPLLIGILSNQRTEAKVRLYEKHFGNPAGAYFLYNSKTGNHEGLTEH